MTEQQKKASPDFSERRKIVLYMVLCCAVYFSSYVTRKNFQVGMEAIVEGTGIAKSMLSLAVSGAFVTYGLGQIISGALGDKFQPQKVIFTGILGTCLCNILVPLMPGAVSMTVVWCFNGFFQSMLWPPLVRVMAAIFDEDRYRRACIYVNAAAHAGTIGLYVLVPACVTFSGWKTAFFVCAAIGLAIGIVWILFTGKFDFLHMDITVPGKEEQPKEKANIKSIFVCEGLIFAITAILLQGMLRDGVETWTPSFVKENLGFDTSSSILTAIILPVFGILSYSVANVINKRLKDELKSSAVFFVGALATSGVLLAFCMSDTFQTTVPGKALSVLFIALVTGCAHGINLMLVCDLPLKFAKYGKISTVSGMINMFTYVGSSISTYGIAMLVDNKGWYFAIGSWGVTAILGGVMCVLNLVYLKKRNAE